MVQGGMPRLARGILVLGRAACWLLARSFVPIASLSQDGRQAGLNSWSLLETIDCEWMTELVGLSAYQAGDYLAYEL